MLAREMDTAKANHVKWGLSLRQYTGEQTWRYFRRTKTVRASDPILVLVFFNN